MMAGKREKWRVALYKFGATEKRYQVVGARKRAVAIDLSEHTARQIVREHNMHERMLDALKLLFSTLCKGCDQYHQDRCTAVFDETGDEVDCMWGKVGNQTRDLIAEAEKGD